MLKKYRQNFIILNMVTVGLVLLLAFIYIGYELYSSSYDELKNVMSMIVKPWNSPQGKTAFDGELPEKRSDFSQVWDEQNKNDNAARPEKPQQPESSSARDGSGNRHEMKEK